MSSFGGGLLLQVTARQWICLHALNLPGCWYRSVNAGFFNSPQTYFMSHRYGDRIYCYMTFSYSFRAPFCASIIYSWTLDRLASLLLKSLSCTHTLLKSILKTCLHAYMAEELALSRSALLVEMRFISLVKVSGWLLECSVNILNSDQCVQFEQTDPWQSALNNQTFGNGLHRGLHERALLFNLFSWLTLVTVIILPLHTGHDVNILQCKKNCKSQLKSVWDLFRQRWSWFLPHNFSPPSLSATSSLI